MNNTTTARDSFASLWSRPACEDPGITLRPEGRQLHISRGVRPEADTGRDLTWATTCDDQADGDGEADTEAGADVPTRGRITGYSAKSRRRMRKTIHQIDRRVNALFVTLTLHKWRPTPEEMHTALDTFWKRVHRRHPGLSAVWKLEPQTKAGNRGVPHFHLLIYGTSYINAQWLSRQWHALTGEESFQHEKAGVDVALVDDDERLAGYTSKYMDKTFDGWPQEAGEPWKTPGRFWGVLNRDALPVAAWADWSVHLSGSEAAWIIRTLLDEWEVDTGGALPPSLTINTRGDPSALLDRLLKRIRGR